MVYSKGNKMIAIEHQPLIGKRPELFIGTGSPPTLTKVASFSNPERAEQFEEWLRYFFGDMLVDGDGEE